MKPTPLAKSTGLVAFAGLAVFATAAKAQTFNYSDANLLVGFRQTGAANDLLFNLGPVSGFDWQTGSIKPGTTVTVGDATTVNSAFTSLNNLEWASFAGVKTSGGSYPVSSLFVTAPGSPSAPWLTDFASSQGGTATRINSIGVGGKNYGAAIPTAVPISGAVLVPAGNAQAYDTFVKGAGSAANFQGTFQGNVEVNTGASFSAGSKPASADLYELKPDGLGNNGVLLGTFQLNKTGQMTFTAVPEPNTFALIGLGGAIALVVNRRRA